MFEISFDFTVLQTLLSAAFYLKYHRKRQEYFPDQPRRSIQPPFPFSEYLLFLWRRQVKKSPILKKGPGTLDQKTTHISSFTKRGRKINFRPLTTIFHAAQHFLKQLNVFLKSAQRSV